MEGVLAIMVSHLRGHGDLLARCEAMLPPSRKATWRALLQQEAAAGGSAPTPKREKGPPPPVNLHHGSGVEGNDM